MDYLLFCKAAYTVYINSMWHRAHNIYNQFCVTDLQR